MRMWKICIKQGVFPGRTWDPSLNQIQKYLLQWVTWTVILYLLGGSWFNRPGWKPIQVQVSKYVWGKVAWSQTTMFWVLSVLHCWSEQRNYFLLKMHGGYDNENCTLWNLGYYYLYAFDRIKKTSTASVCDTFWLVKKKGLILGHVIVTWLLVCQWALNDLQAILFFYCGGEFYES